MPTPGISFSLFDNDNGGQNRDSQAGATPSPQDAIRLLSLHIPKVVGASSPIPSLLLNAPGAAALGGGAMGVPGGDLEELIRRLYGGGGVLPGMGGFRPSAPPPNFTPIGPTNPVPPIQGTPLPPRAGTPVPADSGETNYEPPAPPVSREPREPPFRGGFGRKY
jgi:hypothetical protein